MKKTTLIIIILFIFIIFNKQDSEKNEWMGFYYPDRNDIGNEKTWVIQSNLNSLEECQDWIADTATENDPLELFYDYECGYNCKYDYSYQTYICKKTVK